MALNLVMLGPPGAGKGTQAERFARTRGIPKISTGDMLREAVKAGTEMGLRAKAVMDRGDLVSDEIMIGIVRDRLTRDDARGGFVLDGFPRTVRQAEALDGIMAGGDPVIVIEIVVPQAELVRRLSTRLICAACGADAAAFEAVAAAVPQVMAQAAPGALESAAQTEPGRCRRCGGLLVQRADDNAAVVLDRLKVYEAQTKPLVEHYSRRPTFRSINGAQPPDRVAADLAAAIEAAGSVGVRQ